MCVYARQPDACSGLLQTRHTDATCLYVIGGVTVYNPETSLNMTNYDIQ